MAEQLVKGKDYEITEIRPFLDITRAGTFVKKYRIYFRDLLTGFEDFVDVEEPIILSPEKVEEIVKERILKARELVKK